MELSCRFCGKIVVDEAGNRTEDFGLVQRGTYICARCAKALEFALGD
ncbi:zinc finger domain-containing protein [Candidatus Nitrososphaera evergladensis]|nr:zinc finger domain-containing protein [Candidatus Nitrososphaera evergladensis]